MPSIGTSSWYTFAVRPPRRAARPSSPPRPNRSAPEPISVLVYALRNRIERCINRLKNARRLATRYDKTSTSYLGFIEVISARLWFRHLST